MDQANVSLISSGHRPKRDSKSSQPSLDPPPNPSDPSPELSGGDAERKHEETIHAQLLAVLSKLEILMDKTRPMQPGIDQEKHGRWSEEWTAKIHTTLDLFRLDMRVWLDDISNSTASLPDAFEDLAGHDMELDQTIRKTLRGMVQHIASMEEMIDSDIAGPSRLVARSIYRL